jgi:hypothetical protein
VALLGRLGVPVTAGALPGCPGDRQRPRSRAGRDRAVATAAEWVDRYVRVDTNGYSVNPRHRRSLKREVIAYLGALDFVEGKEMAIGLSMRAYQAGHRVGRHARGVSW